MMNEKEFFHYLLNNDVEKADAFQRGYEEGVRVFWDQEEECGNPYEDKSLDWWLFEEGKESAGQDL